MAQSPIRNGLLRHGILPLSVVGAAVLTASFARTAAWAPRSLDDVLQAAHKLHLLVRVDTGNGVLGLRLIISENPVSAEQCAEVVMGRWRAGGGPAMVTLYTKPPVDTGYLQAEPEHYAMWGRYLVYGDADLLKRLTSYQPPWSMAGFSR
jgi:hypothetical protein